MSALVAANAGIRAGKQRLSDLVAETDRVLHVVEGRVLRLGNLIENPQPALLEAGHRFASYHG